MGLVMQILSFGGPAFLMFVLSVAFCKMRKNWAGLAFGALELLSVAISSRAWMHALRISGKIDWFLLGIFSYPIIGLIWVAMFAVGLICLAVNIGGLAHRKKSTAPTAQV